MANSNFILKTADTKLSDIQKALQQAGIQVKSIIEVYKEGAEQQTEEVK